MTRLACDALVVGSGFAGSILARCLNAQRRSVLLVERSRHPRFALGESSTPLANLVLERLALRYDLEDLYHLANHARWRRRFPQLTCGRKRGFTFYAHRPGSVYRCLASNANRLLVAASPDDEAADTHWLRAEIDEQLVQRAVAEGVSYRDQTELESLKRDDSGWRIRGRQREEALEIDAGFVVDASGESAWLARQLGMASLARPARFRSRLLFSHFAGIAPFSESAAVDRAADPFPEQWAAVHHLLDRGWMYQLRFDDGITSAGLLLDLDRLEAQGARPDWSDPERLWWSELERFPTLAEQLRAMQPLRPLACSPPLQRRLEKAYGRSFALLPHTYAFFDPLYSTGIAWSLLAVERLAEALGQAAANEPQLRAYGALLAREADHLELLLASAYRELDDFEALKDLSMLYFAAASFAESAQRLLQPDEWLADLPPGGAGAGWAWRGFLGATDPVLSAAFAQGWKRASSRELDGAWVAQTVASRNVAGLCDPRRANLYPAEIEQVMAAAIKLGLDAKAARARAPLLRSPASFERFREQRLTFSGEASKAVGSDAAG